LKNTTAPNLHSASDVTGILDKKTCKIYDVNFLTLLHLGAYSFKMKPDCKIFEKDVKKNLMASGNDEKRIVVLGLNAPALYVSYLYRFQKLS